MFGLKCLSDRSGNSLSSLPSLKSDINEDIANAVTEVNVLSQRIHELNQAIFIDFSGI